MNYKLAKQLKDAGFPQNKCLEIWFSHKGKNPRRTYWEILFNKDETPLRHPWHKDTEFCVIPTLSELIEACLKLVPDLFKLEFRNKQWIADTNWKIENGNTPEEAVAKLWLKLNKK